ncbi:MAG: metal ABC transporter permease, partial [Chloroflexi bacterium]|nr:metal ABC transporter permease [Chloroflexota bacterium]
MVDVWGWFADPLEFEFMRRALLAVALVGVVSAVVGAFVVVRGMAFIGDALAHASFAGIAAAFALGVSIYLGAIVAAVATAVGIAFISQRGRIRFDTAIGVLFVGAFALGIVIVSRQDNYTVDLFSFVFGNVLGVSWNDLAVMAVMGTVVVALVGAFYKELLFV